MNTNNKHTRNTYLKLRKIQGELETANAAQKFLLKDEINSLVSGSHDTTDVFLAEFEQEMNINTDQLPLRDVAFIKRDLERLLTALNNKYEYD